MKRIAGDDDVEQGHCTHKKNRVESVIRIHQLPWDTLKVVSEWLESIDIIHVAKSSKNLRLFVKQCCNMLNVSRVQLAYLPQFENSIFLPRTAIFDFHLNLHSGVNCRGVNRDQSKAIRLLKFTKQSSEFWSACKLWNKKKSVSITCCCHTNSLLLAPKSRFSLQCDANEINFNVPSKEFHPPILRIRSCRLLFIDVIESQTVDLNCWNMKNNFCLGEGVHHVSFRVPSTGKFGLQFLKPSLQSLCLRVQWVMHSAVFSFCNLKNYNLFELILQCQNAWTDYNEWFQSFNEYLLKCFNPKYLKRLILRSAFNLVDHKGTFWQRFLGLHDAAQANSSSDTLQGQGYGNYICFQGLDNAQLCFLPESCSSREVKVNQMASQFLSSTTLKTLDFMLSSQPIASSHDSHESKQAIRNTSMMLALAVAEALCDGNCVFLSHFNVYDVSVSRYITENASVVTVDDPIHQIFAMFPSIVANSKGVIYIQTNHEVSARLQSKIVDAIAQNSRFVCFRMETCQAQNVLTYEVYLRHAKMEGSLPHGPMTENKFDDIFASQRFMYSRVVM